MRRSAKPRVPKNSAVDLAGNRESGHRGRGIEKIREVQSWCGGRSDGRLFV